MQGRVDHFEDVLYQIEYVEQCALGKGDHTIVHASQYATLSTVCKQR